MVMTVENGKIFFWLSLTAACLWAGFVSRESEEWIAFAFFTVGYFACAAKAFRIFAERGERYGE